MQPEFLTLGDVFEIHADQIERYGGQSGVRDISLLQSAVALPMGGFGEQYFHKDIFEMAAAYLFHIVQNHPFIDGNKRTGAVAAIVFLDLNGHELICTEEELEQLVLSVASGMADKPQIVTFFRKYCKTKGVS